MTVAKTCECGCGAEVRPGRRFVKGHSSRLRPKAKPAKYGRCPRCGQKVRLRENGGTTRHFQLRGRARVVCPESFIGIAPAPQGMRVKLTVDVILPATWSRTEFRQRLRDLIQAEADEVFLVAAETDPDLEVAS